jgi:hypothetical protein
MGKSPQKWSKRTKLKKRVLEKAKRQSKILD